MDARRRAAVRYQGERCVGRKDMSGEGCGEYEQDGGDGK
jgi:hypothetical protein